MLRRLHPPPPRETKIVWIVTIGPSRQGYFEGCRSSKLGTVLYRTGKIRSAWRSIFFLLVQLLVVKWAYASSDPTNQLLTGSRAHVISTQTWLGSAGLVWMWDDSSQCDPLRPSLLRVALAC